MPGSIAGPSRAPKTGKILDSFVLTLLCDVSVSTSTIRLSAYIPHPYLIISIPKLLSRVGYIDAVRGPSICVVDLRGLLKVVQGTRAVNTA